MCPLSTNGLQLRVSNLKKNRAGPLMNAPRPPRPLRPGDNSIGDIVSDINKDLVSLFHTSRFGIHYNLLFSLENFSNP